MAKQKSDNLSKGDIVSFVAIILLGIIVFFGMNFKTMGDKVPSLIVAILLVVLMTVFVFLAAHAKAQNRNQSLWKGIEYAMVGLYVIALIPCYLYSAKFFGIYFNKSEITQQAQTDMDGINELFSEYNKLCESRCGVYQTTLEGMLTYEEGRAKIAAVLDMNPEDVTQANVKQAIESFSSMLKGGEYKELEQQKNNLLTNVESNIKNWNILFMPQYAAELGSAKSKYAAVLKNIYDKHQNELEDTVAEFDASVCSSESTLADTFSGHAGFSVMGLLATLLLGTLGLVKYLLGEKRTVVPLRKGDESVITGDGGIII